MKPQKKIDCKSMKKCLNLIVVQLVPHSHLGTEELFFFTIPSMLEQSTSLTKAWTRESMSCDNEV